MNLRALLLVAFTAAIPALGYSKVLFESGVSGGAPMYLGASSAHPGGGYISFLGGELVNGYNPGNGTQDYTSYTNVIVDTSNAAKNPLTGTDWSFKTQYRSGYERSYQLNTTIIKFPETDVLYVRWYQKWSKDWIWPSDQQKLLKIKGDGISQNFKVSFSNNFINLTHLSPEPYSHLNETYVFSNYDGQKTEFRQEDSFNNKLGPNGEDINYPLNREQWYCIETYVKANGQGASNAEYRYWIDDKLAFELTNTKARTNESAKMRLIELQHVLQGAGNPIDTPTWMSDIVLSTQRIGCGDVSGNGSGSGSGDDDTSSAGSQPMPPTNFTIEQ